MELVLFGQPLARSHLLRLFVQRRRLNPLPGTAITTIDFVHDLACVAMICGLTLGLETPSAEATADARTPHELLEAAQQARAAGKLNSTVN